MEKFVIHWRYAFSGDAHRPLMIVAETRKAAISEFNTRYPGRRIIMIDGVEDPNIYTEEALF